MQFSSYFIVHLKRLSIKRLCEHLKRKRQAYYKSMKEHKHKAIDEAAIIEAVRAIRNVHPEAGSRKLQKYLAYGKYGVSIKVGRDRLFKLMKSANMDVKRPRKKVRTTKQEKHSVITPNLLKDAEITGPYQAFACDITYIATSFGFLYLFLITDVYTREIVGYSIEDTLETKGCIKALNMACRNMPKDARPILHSDRGCQYTCVAYQNMLQARGFTQSMTEEMHCYENGLAERVNGILKNEYHIDAVFPTKRLASQTVAKVIEIYNTMRIHDALGGMTPVEFRKAAA